MKNAPIIFLMIILLGLGLRLWRINIPLLEFYPSRQIQTAEITRNLYRESFNILKPNVRYLGPGPNLFLVEFPLYNSAVAVLYYIFGLHEYLGRIFSVLGWVLSSFFLWKIANKYTGKFAANIALFFYAISPLSVLISRSFQPDQWMLASSLAAIYFLDKWLREKKWLFFNVSIFVAGCSFLFKPSSIIFTLVPLTYLIYQSKVHLIWPRLLAYYSLAVLPSALWYTWATVVSRGGETLQHNVAVSNWFDFEVFLNPSYYSNIFGFEINLVLGPIGILLFLLGLFSRLKSSQNLFYFWLGGVVLYFLIFNKHNMTHEYYHLPLLPIASIFIGLVVVKIYKMFDKLIIKKILSITTLVLFVFASLFVITLTRSYKHIDRFGYVLETATAIKRLTNQNDLIIGLMDEGPSLVYYSDRTGWGFEIDPKKTLAHRKFIGLKDASVPNPIDKLEELKSRGAVVFASSFKPQLLQNKEFSRYIYGKYPVLEETDNYVIFDLKKTANDI